MQWGERLASIAVMLSITKAQAFRAALQVALVLAMALLPLHQAQARLLIRLAHVVAEDTPKGLMAQRFKALVEQRSGGEIAVEVYPSARLYGDRDEMEALQIGAVEMLAPSLSKFGRVGVPEFELFDLPFLFNDMEEVKRITEGPVGHKLLEALGRQHLVGLGYLNNGFKQMSANRPLLAPSDFRGLRMRVQTSRVIAAQMRALGAYPVALPFSETREALSRNVVQGTENPLSNFWTQNMHRYQSDLSLTDHAYLGYAIVTSERFWRSLSDAQRALIGQALREAVDYGNRIADAENNRALQALRASGSTRIHTLTPAQRARLRQAVQPVYEQLKQRIGPQWIHEVERSLGR